jgi:hypothetical protein
MTTQEAAGDEVTVAELAAQFAQFRQSAEAQITSLTEEVARLGSGVPPSEVPPLGASERGGEADDAVAAIEDRPVSRRGALLAMGGWPPVGSAWPSVQPFSVPNRRRRTVHPSCLGRAT